MKTRRTWGRARRSLSAAVCVGLLLSLFGTARAAEPREPRVTAYSAVVMDYATGATLYEKDADSMQVPASMTKVMTAYIIFEELEAGRLSLDTPVPVSEENARRSRDQQHFPMSVPLEAGSEVPVETLLKLILLPSASASCIVMAEFIAGSEEAFVARMNETAQRLGMTAKYENCHGAAVHYLTARSQAMLVREFIRRFPQVLEYTSQTSVEFGGKTYTNTNHLLPGESYEYAGADGFKTGTIRAAGYCLCATAKREGRRIITVVMHSSNDETRHTDSIALLDHGFALLEARRPHYYDLEGHWALEAVEELTALGAELHAEEHTFFPDAQVTRAEFTAMLYTAMKAKGAVTQLGKGESFSDLAGHWAEKYIQEAAAAGLVGGVGDGRFAPDATITREEMMTIIDRAVDLPEANGLGFPDDGELDLWALQAAARTTAAGLFKGNDEGKLTPLAVASRAEAAQVVARTAALMGEGA